LTTFALRSEGRHEMSIRNLDCIFHPKRIAVIGASDDRSKVGYTVLRNMVLAGFDGVVYPVNPHREAVQGIQSHACVAALPKPADLAVICTPARGVPGLVRECGEAGIHGVVILSAGFRETGPEGRILESEIASVRARFNDLRIIGPNCLGVIAPHAGVNVSFAADLPRAGSVALISQSGALCTSLLDWAVEHHVGFSYFVSIGNMIDVGFGDLIDYFGEDPQTESILLYAESISDARTFMSAARAFARTKPIVAYKAGRFSESAHAAASHTGAMAGEDAVCEAAFQRAGIERVEAMGEMFDCAHLLARHRPPRGERLAIVTNAGGPGVMATDALIARGGRLAALHAKTLARLDALLPAWWSHGNPVDVLGDAPPERFAEAVTAVLEDETVDAVLVLLTPQAMTEPTLTAGRLADVARTARKPLLAAWLGGRRVREGASLLAAAGVASYGTPEDAVNAFMHLVSYARNIELLYETPREMPGLLGSDRKALVAAREALRAGDSPVLSETASKGLLAGYRIPVVQSVLADSADAAAAAAGEMGYPVALKIHSPQITHKTDVGGVALDIRTEVELRAAFEQVIARSRAARPEAVIKGVAVQRMIDRAAGVELIAGMKRDATFGAVLMVGAGGVAAEVFRDRALGLPPLNERLARRMLESLRSWPLLTGYRGRPAVDLDALIDSLIRLSYLVAQNPEIEELDINPLLALPRGVVALDARVIVDRQWKKSAARPYAHLAIRPYPEEFIKQDRLADGRPVTLRPIRPEDEPLWLDLISRCSAETLHARFRYLFKSPSHQIATRYCVLDYDRELAIMAEIEEQGARQFIGVARLAADANHETAEFAILVADAWQNQGLGLKLTDHMLEIAKGWGVRRIVAETTIDNPRMVAIFEQRGFRIERNLAEGSVAAERVLSAEGRQAATSAGDDRQRPNSAGS
jgi:acetyltransferase